MNYNLNKVILSKLGDVKEFDNKKYYRYNEIDFYFKGHDDSDKLLVSFHAANAGNAQNIKAPLPIFRGFNWEYNVLCISDKLIELYPELSLGWYLSPLESNIMDTYVEIIGLFLDTYKNVVFTGTSGGGFPSLLFSSYFKKKALIQNSQIYLENYYSKLNDILHALSIKQTDLSITNGEDIVVKYGNPFMVFIYCNINDLHHYEKHYLPFYKYINENNLQSHFKFIEFVGTEPVPPQIHHHILLPTTKKNVNECIDELFMFEFVN